MRAVAHSPSSLKRISPTIVFEGVGVDVFGQLVVLEAAGRPDRLLQHLHRGIGKRRLVEAERVGAGVLGLCLVLLQKTVDPREA
jgi:hypothetical protein